MCIRDRSVKRTGSSSLSAPRPKINLSASVPNTPRLSIVDDADFDDSASDNGSTSNSIAGHSTSQHVDDVRGPLVYLSAVKQSASTHTQQHNHCLLYTSDAADDLLCVDLGGRRIIYKKKKNT
eukprot:TRINITY_DN3579_c0_g1_i1.p1 TRINITY_DN3579_c0_g1~~TRINITY_DN3579_c0_g1_i1.p1  ORF type:complete len:123 (-),score=37.24 TRINITY_DN3579_c0_g1_i1:66-434(-)